MEKLLERLNELSGANFSGTVTLSYYKGSLSKKIKIEVTENLKLDESLLETTGTNSKEKSWVKINNLGTNELLDALVVCFKHLTWAFFMPGKVRDGKP